MLWRSLQFAIVRLCNPSRTSSSLSSLQQGRTRQSQNHIARLTCTGALALCLGGCSLFVAEPPEEQPCPDFGNDKGLHLRFTGENGSPLSPGEYDFLAYVDAQVIRLHCSVAAGTTECGEATGFQRQARTVYGYAKVDEQGPPAIELVLLRNDNVMTGGPVRLVVEARKDGRAIWGPDRLTPEYDRMTPAREGCAAVEVSYTALPLALDAAEASGGADSEGGVGTTGGGDPGMDSVDDQTDDDDAGELDESGASDETTGH